MSSSAYCFGSVYFWILIFVVVFCRQAQWKKIKTIIQYSKFDTSKSMSYQVHLILERLKKFEYWIRQNRYPPSFHPLLNQILSMLALFLNCNQPCLPLCSFVFVLNCNYRKVANNSLSWLVAHFQKAYKEEIWCLCTLTFDQKVPKLDSRPVYCLQL